MSTPNSENQTLINEDTSPSSILPKTSLKIPMPMINRNNSKSGKNVGRNKNLNNLHSDAYGVGHGVAHVACHAVAHGAAHGGGFAGRDYTGNVIHNYTDASLNETVAKIETLINDLCRNSPVNSTSQQMTIATQVIGAIEDDLDWRQKTIQACQQGLLEAIKTNPIGAFVAGAIEGWQ